MIHSVKRGSMAAAGSDIRLRSHDSTIDENVLWADRVVMCRPLRSE